MRYVKHVPEWISPALEEDGVVERRLDVLRDGARVPGVLWTPARAAAPPEPSPLVLLGHGGAGHKRDASRLDYARGYVARGLAAAAIDGPFHGDRAPAEPDRGSEERSFDEALVDAMVANSRVTLDALVALEEIDAGRVGYGGVSMGTMFGLPFVTGGCARRCSGCAGCAASAARTAAWTVGCSRASRAPRRAPPARRCS